MAPQARAALQMRTGDPAAAVRAVADAAPFMFRELDAPNLKADALLAAHDGPAAAAAFRAILAHPGLSTDPLYDMAHLGLARANRLTGDLPGARREYQTFLNAWRDADPDLAVLKAAKTEISHLPGA